MNIIKQIIIKEFLQLKRDPKLFAIAFIAPVMQLFFLGYAATMDVNTVTVIVMDYDKSQASRNLVDKFTGSGYFEVNGYAENYNEIINSLDNGDAFVALVIPIDFEEKINRRENVKLQAIFDGANGNKSTIAAGYVNGIVNSFSREIMVDNLNRQGIKISPVGSITSEARVWYNPDLKTRNFMLPSIMGLILMVITTILMAMAIVKEREIGTLEQLIVTPIKPYQLIVGKLIPFAILGAIDVLLVNFVMIFWFGIAIRGSFLFLLLSSFIYILSTLGIGLFVSTISKTQQQAMLVALFAIMMPMIYLSGFAFPIENMPPVIQFITHFIPLKYFIIIIRDIILKGSTFNDLIPETLILLGMGLAILILSALRFKKRLE